MNEKTYRKSSLFPTPLSKCVEKITKPAFKKQGLAGTKIVSEWESIVGKKLADHCIPQKLSFAQGKKTDGTLTIAVENGFAPELQHAQNLIIEKIAFYFGYKAVSRISISHSYFPETQKTNEKLIKGTLSKDSVKTAESIEDEELRKIFTNMARTLCSEK